MTSLPNEPAPPIHEGVLQCREFIPIALNAMGLLGEGAEIGVQYGVYSAQILTLWKGKRLYSIDPWRHFAQETYLDDANQLQAGHDQTFAAAETRLSKFGERSKIIRDTSALASRQFKDSFLDFIYIDAQHHYEAVCQDLRLWYPKLKSGGLISGHDYFDGFVPEMGLFGVKRAVLEFAYRRGLTVLTTKAQNIHGQESGFPSWMIVKP